jgi:hypothetical protein
MRKTVHMITAVMVVIAATLVPAQASAAPVPYRSSACPSYACGSATATDWYDDGRGLSWGMSVRDTSCGPGSPTAVVKIRIKLSNGSSLWTTPRPDTNCRDNELTPWSDYFFDSHLKVEGFWVRIDNGANNTPFTQGNWVENPNF